MINAAVIGLGRWGKSLVDRRAGQEPKLRFVHGVSKEPDDVRGFAAQHGFRLSTDLADAIADPRCRRCSSPRRIRCMSADRAVARASKPVWCEKPLALTAPKPRRAVAACREAGSCSAAATTSAALPRCAS
jgi:predicted dehydrogenase